MIRIYCIILLLILSNFRTSVFGIGTRIDSLEKVLKVTVEIETKFSILFSLTEEYIKSGKYTSAEKYAIMAHGISQKLKKTEKIANIQFLLGQIYYQLHKNAEAMYFSNQCLKHKIILDDKIGIANCNNMIGNIYFTQNKYENALRNYISSIKIYENLKDSMSMANGYSNLANIYFMNNDTYNASIYQEKNLLIINIKGSSNQKAISHIRLGDILMKDKKYKAAQEKYMFARDLSENDATLARATRKIAETQMIERKYKEALENYNISTNIILKLGDETQLPDVYFNIGVYYDTIKQKQKALEYYQLSYTKALNINQIDIAAKSAREISKLFAKNHEFELSYYYLNKFYEISEKINGSETTRKITELELKYQFEKDSLNIAEKFNIDTQNQQIEIKNQRSILLFLMVVLVLIGIMGFWVFKSYNGKRKALEELKKLNANINEHREELSQQNDEIFLKKQEIENTNLELELQKKELQKQKELLEDSNVKLERLSIVASQTDNAILIMDKTGKFEWVNESFTRIFSYTLEELIQNVSENIIGPNTPIEIKNLIEKCVQNKETVMYQLPARTKTNKLIWVHTTLTPVLDKNGDIRNLIAIDSDITKQKEVEDEVLKQKEEIEISHQRINSSIRYAQSIQASILPPKKYFDKFCNSFLMYHPKDIVSGDYYWIHHIKSERYTETIVALVDSTGHGVPGAFLAVIGHSLLNEIIKERQITNPAEILHELSNSVVERLNQIETDNEDGMDIALLRIREPVIKGDPYEIIFAGACLPCYYYSTENEEIGIIKGDNKTIGGFLAARDTAEFVNNSLQLFSGDMIYLVSDGFQDQNSPTNARFGLRKLQKMLTEAAEMPIGNQESFINLTLKEHQKDCVQRDDITLLGFQLL